MARLTFKNRRGELVDVPTVAATKVKNEFGQILEQATDRGAVAITRHDTTKAVLLSVAEFESLVSARSRTLDVLTNEFDEILERMQTEESRRGMKAAFNASPAQLGRAAVAIANDPSRANDPLAAPEQSQGSRSFQEQKALIVAEFERAYIRGLLNTCGGNVTQAARAAGKDRRAFWELVRKHKVGVRIKKS
jgi:prevent-host-death family protein